jgi:hypothetical protein
MDALRTLGRALLGGGRRTSLVSLPGARIITRPRAGSCFSLGGIRAYIDGATYERLKDSEAFKVLVGRVSVQEPSHCVRHIADLRRTAEADMVAQGVLSADGKQAVHARSPGQVSVDQCLQWNREHGLGEFILPGVDPDYPLHHATLLVHSFRDDTGRAVALVADCSELRDGPGMRAIRAWLDKEEDSRKPWQLGADDFEKINQTLPKDGALKDVRQDFFRLVDLEQFIGVKVKGLGPKLMPVYPPEIRFGAGKLAKPLVTPEEENALRAAIARNPRLVEQFPFEVRAPKGMLLALVPPIAGLVALSYLSSL